VKKNSFELLELEMADLERFWRNTPLDPLGVKKPNIQVVDCNWSVTILTTRMIFFVFKFNEENET
jgi:hypothetical protein